MPRLLIVDEDPLLLKTWAKNLTSTNLTVLTAETARVGINRVQVQAPDVVLLDVCLPDMPGQQAFAEMRRRDPHLPVIFMTANGSADTVMAAMEQGAFDFLFKPVGDRILQDTVARALDLATRRRVSTVVEDEECLDEGGTDGLVGRCPAMVEVYKAVGRVAGQDVTVLLLGESGTGKELVARALYRHSRRSDGLFLAVNCAAIPGNLVESELFGYERGAFTGADHQHIGRFEQATGGTVFLDEVGTMSGAMQAKMLRLLQEQQFERLGSNHTSQIDVRIIAATNCDLDTMVEAGRFRQDLFYRLNQFTIRLPPLRQRGADLPVLIDYFLRRFNKELGKKVDHVTDGALRAMEDYPWPGNLRELQNALRFALFQTSCDVLTYECLPQCIRLWGSVSGIEDGTATGSGCELQQLVRRLLRAGARNLDARVRQEMDRQLLSQVLQHVGNNMARACDVLGICRNHLKARLRDCGLRPQKPCEAKAEDLTGT